MRILFITSTRIGDAVLSTGLLGHLVETYPEARITIVCGPLAAALFRAVPGLEETIVLRKRRLSAHWLWLWSRVMAERWDLVIDLRNSLVSRLIRSERRAILPREIEGAHQVERIGRTLGLMPPPAPRLWFGETERTKAAALVPAGPPILALAPTANWPGKTWPVERFAELAHRLTDKDGLLPGAWVAVFGTAAERQQAACLLQAIPRDRLLDLMGRTNPLEAGACLQRCTLFIGNDSGLMHIAAAVGTPTLGLFGATPPERYGPWGRHTAYVVGTRSYDELVSSPDYRKDSDRTYMDSLSLETVQEAARALWAATGGSSMPATPGCPGRASVPGQVSPPRKSRGPQTISAQ